MKDRGMEETSVHQSCDSTSLKLEAGQEETIQQSVCLFQGASGWYRMPQVCPNGYCPQYFWLTHLQGVLYCYHSHQLQQEKKKSGNKLAGGQLCANHTTICVA